MQYYNIYYPTQIEYLNAGPYVRVLNMKNIYRMLIFCVLVMVAMVSTPLCNLQSHAANVDFTFQWDANHPNDNVVSYRIYWSDTSGVWSPTDREEVTVASLADPDNPAWTITLDLADENERLFFVATAEDDNYESDYSDQVATSVVSMDNIDNEFVINSDNYNPFTLSGQSETSSIVTIFINGLSVDDVTADGGTWTYDADFTPIPQGEVTIEARIIASGDSSGVFTGIYDRNFPGFDLYPAAPDPTMDSATVSWVTDESTTGILGYSATSGAAWNTMTQMAPSGPATSHSVELTDLSRDTTYYFVVRSEDAVGNVVFTDQRQFTTLADTTPPTISSVLYKSVENDSATIEWSTADELGDSEVQFGTGSSTWDSYPVENTIIEDHPPGEPRVIAHSVNLTGLSGSTEYFFRVGSTDSSGNQSTSSQQSFTTGADPDTTPPVISNGNILDIEYNSARIVWDTDEPADSTVEYGLTTSYGESVYEAADVIHREITLSGLLPETTYHIRLRSEDEEGNETVSGDYDFTTAAAPDETAPVIEGSVLVPVKTETSVTIEWTTDEESDSQVRYGIFSSAWTGYPQPHIIQTAPIKNHSVTISGLTSGTLYYFMVGSTDDDGNGPTLSSEGDFQTLETPLEPPTITSQPQVMEKDDTSATIQWLTQEPSNSQVRFGTTAGTWETYPDTNTVSDFTMVQTHTIVLNGLSPPDHLLFSDRIGGGVGQGRELSLVSENHIADRIL